MRALPILLMVAAGILMSLQGPVNSRLRVAAESPVLSAAISFLTGGLILVPRIAPTPLRLLGLIIVFVGVLLVQKR